jgi:K+-transporting ATPase A subunit
MFFARYWLAIPTLAIAGALAKKKLVPTGPGTLPTHTPLFIAMVTSANTAVRRSIVSSGSATPPDGRGRS